MTPSPSAVRQRFLASVGFEIDPSQIRVLVAIDDGRSVQEATLTG